MGRLVARSALSQAVSFKTSSVGLLSGLSVFTALSESPSLGLTALHGRWNFHEAWKHQVWGSKSMDMHPS